MEDPRDAPALLGPEGVGSGEVGAEGAADSDPVGVSSAPELRTSVVSAMALAQRSHSTRGVEKDAQLLLS